MSIYKALKFVQGAMKGGIASDLKHYRIIDGTISGFNGMIGLSAPIDIKLTAFPEAATFAKAIAACDDSVKLSLSNGKVLVASRGFRAFVPSLDDVAYAVKPEGKAFPCPKDFVQALADVVAFVADQSPTPWANGVLVDGACLTATNNQVIIQRALESGSRLPRGCLPKPAALELVRIGDAPERMMVNDYSMSFLYSDGRWLRTQLFNDQWPADKLDGILANPGKQTKVPTGLAAAIEKIAPFKEDNSSSIFFEDGFITTLPVEGEGVDVRVPDLPAGACFALKNLMLVREVIHAWNLAAYPDPVCFSAKNIRGALIGQSR